MSATSTRTNIIATVQQRRTGVPLDRPAADCRQSAARSGGGREAGIIEIAVLASDLITGEGTLYRLRNQPGLKVLAARELARAGVVLMLATEVTEETMLLMESVAAGSSNPGMGIVLVAESMREHYLPRAVRCGLRSVMWRRETDFGKVLEAVRGVGSGRGELPPSLQGWLLDRFQAVQHEVLAPLGLTASGLDTREVAVLRLLAEGRSTGEIAQELNYAERTIKNIVSSMMSRLRLRNRTHAVAHALRSGDL